MSRSRDAAPAPLPRRAQGRRRGLVAQGRRRGLMALGAVGAAGLLGSLAAGWPSSAQAQAPARAGSTAEPPRLALLIGNREYPDGEDLPPIHKNVNDLRAALEQRGFACQQGLDLDAAASRMLIEGFAAQVRNSAADATVLFYFSGHGAQVDAENLLVGARQNPKARAETLMRGSLTLTRDVMGVLPRRPQGLTIAVLDACRTSLKSALESDGLNQVEAPPGSLIAFATGAGRPAIAPAVETVSTFYTASLVKLLQTASDEISFSDLFRLVKADVQSTMLSHPLPLLRQFAQFPFIAENTQVQRRLAPRPAGGDAAAARFQDGNEEADFALLEAALWPADVVRLASAFLQRYPQSRLAGSVQVALDGAQETAQILRRTDVRLFRSAFQPAQAGSPQRIDIAKAARGDKDAAARVAQFHRNAGPPERFEGWMQLASAQGNGIAAYELALFYRRSGQPLLAAQFEARARALGYTPPPSLDNSRK